MPDISLDKLIEVQCPGDRVRDQEKHEGLGF